MRWLVRTTTPRRLPMIAPCLVTDWVPPELVGVGTTPDAAPVDTRIPTAPSPDTGGAIPITPSHPAAGARIMPGSGRTFLVRQNGAVWAWGNNTEGRLGDGTTTSTSEPVPLPTLQSGVSALSTFWQHTCAVVSGALYCWGKNDHGQLGDGTKTNSGLPVPVVGLSAGVTDVAVSNEHTCAVVNGGAQCWGASYPGVRLLGDDSTVDRTVPRPVPTLSSGVTAIAAGYYYACAVVDGEVSAGAATPKASLAIRRRRTGRRPWRSSASKFYSSGRSRPAIATPVPSLKEEPSAVGAATLPRSAAAHARPPRSWSKSRGFPGRSWMSAAARVSLARSRIPGGCFAGGVTPTTRLAIP